MAISNPGNVAFLLGSAGNETLSQQENEFLALASALQASLEIEGLFQTFHNLLKDQIAFESLGYMFEPLGIETACGIKARHSVSYQLTINDEELGTVWLTRRKRLSAPEAERLERLLCALLYPLRNALKYQRALRAAYKDTLTGIDNRAAMDEAIRREVDLARRHQRSLALIVMDIDFFKRINDTYGHATGDCLLRALADCAKDSIRGSDRIFRYGGEEFVALLPETGIQGARQLAERIRRNVAALDPICGGKPVKMTVSLGVAVLDAHDDPQSLFNRADQALYAAKHNGRNQVKLAARNEPQSA